MKQLDLSILMPKQKKKKEGKKKKKERQCCLKADFRQGGGGGTNINQLGCQIVYLTKNECFMSSHK